MAPAQSGPVLTSVAPRDRPVTTSLAPRQRPKGNNKTFVSEDDSAAPFKNSNNSGGTLKRGTKLRRSQSLKESKNLSGNNSPKVEKRQLQNQTPSVSQQQLYQQQQQQQQQQNFDIQAQQQQAILTQDQQQYLLLQQQRQQQEIFMRQQQQQYQYYQQLHQQKLQQQQQQQQQQNYLMQQQRQQQEYIQHQREILMRQQEQDMLQRQQQEQILRQQQQQEELLRQQQEMQKQEQLRQQQQQEYMRQRQEEYLRLKKLQEQEENKKSFRDRLDTDDFNPRQCRSVEPPKSPELKHKNIFDDDFTRSSPDLVNPFVQNATQKSNPFQEKKKTHVRSRSDTFTRLASRSDFLNKENKLDTAPEEMTSSQSSGNIHETVEQDKTFSQGVALGQNPFIPYSDSTANKMDSNEEDRTLIDGSESKSKQERSVELERQDSNVETGILLEIDDDENFIRLQKELKELGVLNDMLPLESSNKDFNTDKTDSMIGEQRKRTQSDVSPLISPLATSPDNERKYIYKRSSSCSSSEKDSSDFSDDDVDDHYDSNVNKTKTPQYEDLKHDQLKEHPGTVKSSQLQWQEEPSKDIFDLAPFVKTKETRTEQKKKLDSKIHKPEQTKANQFERRNAKKIKSPTVQNDVYSPFDDDFSKDPSNANNSHFGAKLNSDPFKMAPMKISKGKEKAKFKDKNVTKSSASVMKGQEVKVITSNVNTNKNLSNPFEGNNFTSNNSNYEDPFGSAPFLKITSKNVRNVPSSELHVRVKRRNKRMLPNIPNSSASPVTGITTSHR